MSTATLTPPSSLEFSRFTSYAQLVAHLESPLGGGMTKGQATNEANRQRPDLRAKYARRGDGRSVSAQTLVQPAPPAKSAVSDVACASFTDYAALVAHLQTEAGGGMTKAHATREANRRRPDLRAKYVGRI
jgi:hypothetical protein